MARGLFGIQASGEDVVCLVAGRSLQEFRDGRAKLLIRHRSGGGPEGSIAETVCDLAVAVVVHRWNKLSYSRQKGLDWHRSTLSAAKQLHYPPHRRGRCLTQPSWLARVPLVGIPPSKPPCTGAIVLGPRCEAPLAPFGMSRHRSLHCQALFDAPTGWPVFLGVFFREVRSRRRASIIDRRRRLSSYRRASVCQPFASRL
jgi:hypothetical protein